MSKLNVLVIAKIFVLAITSLIYGFTNCRGNKVKQFKANIISVRLTLSMPGLDEHGNVTSLRDTMQVHYYQDLVIYQLKAVNSTQKTIVNKSGEIISEELINYVTRPLYFVYRKGDRKGQLFDTFPVKKPYTLDVDSFLHTKWTIGLKNLYSKDPKNDSVVRSLQVNNGLVEVFVPKVKYDASFNDSTFYYYSPELKYIPFSFIPEEDSLKKMKLYMITVIYNENKKAADPYQRLAKKFHLEMAVIDPDRTTILQLAKLYNH